MVDRMIEARLDRGGLRAAFDASMRTPCVAEKLAGTTFEDFDARVEDMRVLSFYDGEQPIGAAVFQGRIGHIGVLQAYHGKWANRTVLRAISDAWGNGPQALVDVRNDKALIFTAKLGLRPVRQDGYMVRFQ